MSEAEAISLLLKVAREWLECNPSRGNGESGMSSERVREAVATVSVLSIPQRQHSDEAW